jgi:endonuclease YncB( thermonuclease family)
VKTIRSLSPSVFAVGFLVPLLANTVLGQQSVIYGRVVGLTDGDTLKVLVAGQELLRVRIAFCDAPEKRQAFGTRAKQAMSELAFGKEIELRKHAIDRYGRTVAQVFVDGKDVGLEMLRQGFAWVYDPTSRRHRRKFRRPTGKPKRRPRRNNEDCGAIQILFRRGYFETWPRPMNSKRSLQIG